MNSNCQEINQFLDTLLFKLIQIQQIDISELKTLLLICYHQLIEDKPDKLTNSFLITTLKQFIDIEDYCNIILPSQEPHWEEEEAKQYLKALMHPRIIQITEENT